MALNLILRPLVHSVPASTILSKENYKHSHLPNLKKNVFLLSNAVNYKNKISRNSHYRLSTFAISETSVSEPVDITSTKDNKELPDVKAVLFDMDGVLCNSEERSREAAVALFEEMGYKVTTPDFVPFMGTGEANFLGGVAKVYQVKDFDPAKAKERFFEIYIEKYAKPNSGLGYEGALDLILQCKSAGLKTAVASSADRIKVNANLSASGIPITTFDAIVSADLFENLKPAPDIFLAAAKELGIPPSQCIVIEDALAGVQAANAARMRSIAVTTTLSESTLSSAQPKLIKSDISKITMDDILSLKNLPLPKLKSDEENELNGKGNVVEISENVSVDWLDEPLFQLEGNTITRRSIIRFGSLSAGIGTFAFGLTHLKAMSYVSPQAILNLIFGTNSPPPMNNVSDRVSDLKEYISRVEKKGGLTQVQDFDSGLDWLNSPPLSIKRDLKGKVLLYDFWTYCCINCMHVLPDLAFLENKYKDQPVAVIGVHSAKFDNEKDLGGIRNAVLRYDITHPVVNDSDMILWRALGISSWPSIALISPNGNLLGIVSGENHREDLDDLLQACLSYYGEKGQLDSKPIPQLLEKDKNVSLVNSPLKFPGKIAVDTANNRLFISDSNHHRIVVTDFEGNFLTQIGGSEGLTDGNFETAQFYKPQGLAYNSAKNVLYVADTENHALREIDFINEKVTTLCGNGKKGNDYKGGLVGTDQVMNSPWDLVLDKKKEKLYIAMAGQHQIWVYDLETKVAKVFSGNGYERNLNGKTGADSAYAQPSGLSLSNDGEEIFVADSESSSLRSVDLKSGGSKLLAGGDSNFSDNLFLFGDKDGMGSYAKLQHPLGVLASSDNKIYVADSYNHKIKVFDPTNQRISTVAGNGEAGFKDGDASISQFSEPSGLVEGPDGKLLIADTNNSVIRVIDAKNNYQISTLDLSSVPPPVPAQQTRPRRLRKGLAVDADIIKIGQVAASEGVFEINISIPNDYHFTKGASSRYEITTESGNLIDLDSYEGVLVQNGLLASKSIQFKKSNFNELSNASELVRVNCKIYYCQLDEVCLYKSVTFEIPISKASIEEIDDSPKKTELAYNIMPKKV